MPRIKIVYRSMEKIRGLILQLLGFTLFEVLTGRSDEVGTDSILRVRELVRKRREDQASLVQIGNTPHEEE